MDIEKFLENGWIITEFPRPDLLNKILLELKDIASRKTTCFLSQIHYHHDDAETKEMHTAMSAHLWRSEYSLALADALLPVLTPLLGLDIMVQYFPYMRIARPGKPQDNIGYHKDTQYGQTPYELAVHIPFTNLGAEALRVITGSHVMSEHAFKLANIAEAAVEKGSIENKTGRPYAPKRLAVPEGMETAPLSMSVGKMAIFSPAIFHGQEINAGHATRVSLDVRFVSARAPVKIREGKVHAGYVRVSESPIERLAAKYYEANPMKGLIS